MTEMFTRPFPDDDKDLFPPEAESLTGNATTEARLCTVQAVYGALVTENSYQEMAEEFLRHRLRARKADKKLFKTLLEDMAANHARYEELVGANLGDEWTYDRIGNVEKALLLTAACELSCRPDTPFRVVITEYVNIAKGFFEKAEVGFVNAVADAMAGKLRPDEVGQKRL